MPAGPILSLVIGAIAGWLAGKLVSGRGQGIFLNMVTGIIGAVLASSLFPLLGLNLGGEDSLLGAIASATLGAVLLLLAIRLVNRA